MAKASGQWLLTASLLSILASSSAGLAQSGRGWVDPPPEAGTPSPAQAPAPSATPTVTPVPATAPAPQQQSSTAPAVQPAAGEKASAEAPERAAAPQEKAASSNIVKQKAAVERKARASSQQASSPRKPKRDEQVARRRGFDSDTSRIETGSVGERRTRITRFGPPPGAPSASGLQVMRLRTIQLPDGRRIEILTRPDQALTSEMMGDGY